MDETSSMLKIHFLRYIALLLLLFAAALTFAQNQRIPIKNDTLNIWSDSLFYRFGDDMNGQIKYCSSTWFTIIDIADGYRVKESSYDEKGKKRFETNYKNREMHGGYKMWNSKGVLLQKGYYKNGLADSVWTYYDKNGMKNMEASYIADTAKLVTEFEMLTLRDYSTAMSIASYHSPPHGTWKFYDSKGILISSIWFERGVLKGIQLPDDGEEY